LSSESVEKLSRRTKGRDAAASHCIGRATPRATTSGLSWPSRLGTSSPTTIVT